MSRTPSVDALLSRLNRWLGGRGSALAGTSRHRYKETWNALSASIDEAKSAVSGKTDEAELAESGAATLDLLRTTVGIRPEDVVLEIGCGVGRVGAVLAPVCREWIGTDVSENMVEHTRRRLGGHANARAVAVSGYDLKPIPSASVDVVYSTVVFMHLEGWDRFNYICEAFRVLRPGGRLFVDNVNLLSEPGWDLFELNRKIPPKIRPPYITKASTPQELDAYFRRAGFSQIAQQEVSLWVITHGVKPA